MTAKEYLNQARRLDSRIHSRLREIDYWKDLSSSVSSSSFEPHYNPNHPTEAPFVRCIEKIDELQRKVEKEVIYLTQLREEITSRINMLSNEDEQLVLRYRYLNGMSWGEIANKLYYSQRWIYKLHGQALEEFEKILEVSNH